jgi:hypothetical protein
MPASGMTKAGPRSASRPRRGQTEVSLPPNCREAARWDRQSHRRPLTGDFKRRCDVTTQAWFPPGLPPNKPGRRLATKALQDKGKNGEKSVRAVREDVATWKSFIAYAQEVYRSLSESVTLYDFSGDEPEPLLSDPPYGIAFRSNRRWRTTAPDRLEEDTRTEAQHLLTDAINHGHAALG